MSYRTVFRPVQTYLVVGFRTQNFLLLNYRESYSASRMGGLFNPVFSLFMAFILRTNGHYASAMVTGNDAIILKELRHSHLTSTYCISNDTNHGDVSKNTDINREITMDNK